MSHFELGFLRRLIGGAACCDLSEFYARGVAARFYVFLFRSLRVDKRSDRENLRLTDHGMSLPYFFILTEGGQYRTTNVETSNV